MAHPVEQLKQTLIYQGTQAPGAVRDDLVSLRELDKESERQKRNGMLLAIAGFLGVLFSGFLVAQSQGSVIAIGLVVLAGGVFVAGLVWLLRAGAHDLPDHRYELLYQLVNMLRKDMAADATIDVCLDCNSATKSDKHTHSGKIGPWDVKFFRDNWLSLQGRFVDGTHFQVQVAELTQQRSRWKRSMSGKSKYKSKTKTATVSTLQLKVKPHKYPELNTVASAANNLALPQWCQLKKVAVDGQHLALKIGTKAPWSVRTPTKPLGKQDRDGAEMIAMMFVGLYGVLEQAKGAGGTT